ncbi:MAG TPA: ATP-binding protein [Chloroflexota bacterium]|nr:ATP-binding protein [Chloroflexota bacterium]
MAVVVASLVAEAARHLLGIVNISLIYLIVVVAVATLWGLWPALVASLLAATALDFLFVPPFGTLTVAEPGDWLTLLFFLVIAVLTGRLAAGARARAEEAHRRERATAVLYDLSTALIAKGDLAVILPGIARRVAETFALDACHILLPGEDQRLHVVAGFGPWDDAQGRGPQAIMQQVLRDGRAAAVHEPTPACGRGTSLSGLWPRELTPFGRSPLARSGQRAAGRRDGVVPVLRRAPGAPWVALYLPLIVAGTGVGVMRVARSRGGSAFGEEEERLLTTFAHQAALAIDKAHLAERARRAAALEEADQVKTALLSSVSHDLRSPLAAIKTAVTGLLTPGADLDPQGRTDLLAAIDEETDRLTHLVANLLDLSRIQGGALRPRKEWVDIAEIVLAAVDRLASRFPAHAIGVSVPDDLPLLPVDYARVDQVLSNLIENAASYAPPGTSITVTVQPEHGGIALRVRDEGPGIPRAERERVFEPFYRGAATEALRPGSGLGLAICRGIVEAHGGWIRVEPTDGPGASIALWLPGGDVTNDTLQEAPTHAVEEAPTRAMEAAGT